MDIPPIEFELEPQSPENIRIRNVKLELYPDRRRVKVGIRLTPFIDPPNIDINVQDASENLVANATIIGASEPELDLTLHLRGEVGVGEYTFHLTLGYQENESIDRSELTLQIPELGKNSEEL